MRMGFPSALFSVGEVCAPLGDDVRAALLSLFQMLFVEAKSEVSEHDWEVFQHLCPSKNFAAL